MVKKDLPLFVAVNEDSKNPSAPLLRPLPDEPSYQIIGNHVQASTSQGNHIMKLKKYEFAFDLEYEDRWIEFIFLHTRDTKTKIF